uniref:Uncharacterized protein n=1 Tax=Arundo donax TaxID=35708 RepID=A0A0A9CD31_ARUDO
MLTMNLLLLTPVIPLWHVLLRMIILTAESMGTKWSKKIAYRQNGHPNMTQHLLQKIQV